MYGLQKRSADPDGRDGPGASDLEGFRAQMSSKAAHLIQDRTNPTDGNWPWLQPYSNGSNPWPFPARLTGRENAHDLLEESASLNALADHLSCPPFDGLQSYKGANEDDSFQQYVQAIEDWSICLHAAMAMGYLAAILKALTQPESARRCDVCYRYVADGRRTRCFLHHSTAGERNRQLRLTAYTKKFGERLSELQEELGRSAVYARPAQSLAQCWRFGAPVAPASNARRPAPGRWPATSADEAAGQLLDGLHKMVAKLAPVIGQQLHQRMKHVSDAVATKIRNTLGLQPCSTSVAAPRDRQCTSEEAASTLQLATPEGFFRLWFYGFENINGGAELEHEYRHQPPHFAHTGRQDVTAFAKMAIQTPDSCSYF